MKRLIFGMSESRKEIRRKLVNNCEEMDEHLIQILLFPNCDAVSHWKGEVYAFMHKVDRVKGANKYPPYSFIREALAVDEDVLDNYILLVLDEHSELVRSIFSDNEIISCVVAYHEWLSENLSKKGQVLKSEVYNKIDELLL